MGIPVSSTALNSTVESSRVATQFESLLHQSHSPWVVLKPAGDVATQQADLIIVSTLLMLCIIIPVIALTFFFAWKYRSSNTSAPYEPDWDHSTRLELVIWGAPLIIIIILGLITWVSTHKLDPYRPLDRINASTPLPVNAQHMEIQVVALDWKWLFIYPEQGIATVNQLVTPVNRPIKFSITSSTVMNSFFVPALAGQIYAMPGMQTTLHAVLNEPGQFKGFSANYSGSGFSHMRFDYFGKSESDFDEWVAQVKSNPSVLTREQYLAVEKPSTRDPVQHFGSVDDTLFHAVVNRCVAEGTLCMDAQMMADALRNQTTWSDEELAVLINENICWIEANKPQNNQALQKNLVNASAVNNSSIQ